VETVKGYAVQEQKVFGDIAAARAALGGAKTPADKIAASNQIYPLELKVLALSESYPQLKSNENFLRLQDELAGTENRIAVERKRYNDSIQAYNTYIGVLPNNIFAGWAGFKRNNDYFQAAEAAREVPKVQFPAAKP
jgi:LemA protein